MTTTTTSDLQGRAYGPCLCVNEQMEIEHFDVSTHKFTPHIGGYYSINGGPLVHYPAGQHPFNNMKLHPISIESYTSFEDLGRQIAGLRYDLMLEVLGGLHKEIESQAEADYIRGRKKLAGDLRTLQGALECSAECAQTVVDDCKPFIEAEKTERERLVQEQLNRPWRPQVMVKP